MQESSFWCSRVASWRVRLACYFINEYTTYIILLCILIYEQSSALLVLWIPLKTNNYWKLSILYNSKWSAEMSFLWTLVRSFKFLSLEGRPNPSTELLSQFWHIQKVLSLLAWLHEMINWWPRSRVPERRHDSSRLPLRLRCTSRLRLGVRETCSSH
jgi:hypothetical protein